MTYRLRHSVIPFKVYCLCEFLLIVCFCFFFFFNDTATTEIYTLSLHDALPICPAIQPRQLRLSPCSCRSSGFSPRDRKSTRLNSSHLVISYAVFCLKKKKKPQTFQILNDDPVYPLLTPFSRVHHAHLRLLHW